MVLEPVLTSTTEPAPSRCKTILFFLLVWISAVSLAIFFGIGTSVWILNRSISSFYQRISTLEQQYKTTLVQNTSTLTPETTNLFDEKQKEALRSIADAWIIDKHIELQANVAHVTVDGDHIPIKSFDIPRTIWQTHPQRTIMTSIEPETNVTHWNLEMNNTSSSLLMIHLTSGLSNYQFDPPADCDEKTYDIHVRRMAASLAKRAKTHKGSFCPLIETTGILHSVDPQANDTTTRAYIYRRRENDSSDLADVTLLAGDFSYQYGFMVEWNARVPNSALSTASKLAGQERDALVKAFVDTSAHNLCFNDYQGCY